MCHVTTNQRTKTTTTLACEHWPWNRQWPPNHELSPARYRWEQEEREEIFFPFFFSSHLPCQDIHCMIEIIPLTLMVASPGCIYSTRKRMTFVNTTVIAYGQKIGRSIMIFEVCNSGCVHKRHAFASTITYLTQVPKRDRMQKETEEA